MKASFLTNRGFTLVEMVVVCLIFVVVIMITGDAFNRIVSKSVSLNNSAESNIAGIVGLELMRSDLQAAGYGLPWSFSNAITYDEATQEPGSGMNASNSIPRPTVSINNISSGSQSVVFNMTDALAIRGCTVATNSASKCWTYVESKVMPTVNPAPEPHVWQSENLKSTDKIIMTSALVNLTPTNQLVVSDATNKWNTTFDNYTALGKPPVYHDAEKKSDTYVIYGVTDEDVSGLRMPFNRADYYIRRPDADDHAWFRLPERCNSSSGVLIKGVVNQSDGAYTELPVLECVLDMQVVFTLRNPPGSATLTDVSDISMLSAQAIREQLKEIKVYILGHDGARDRNYNYPNATIGVGPGNGLTSGSGSTYDFAANHIPDWRNYHWKVHRVVARPNNLAGNAAQ